MIHINFLAVLVAALIPLIVGMLWYNKVLFGNAWMKAAEMTEDRMKGANMGLIFGLTYLFSFFAAMSLNFIVIHQYHLYSILANEVGINEPGTELNTWFVSFMQKYGTNFRTFKHGAFHGTLAGIMLALPIVGVTALFERRGGKYIAIHVGFWVVSFALMGGMICAWK